MVYEITATVGEEDKHTADVSVLYFKNGKLFSGGNDGKIKIWTSDLKLESTFEAHPVNVYDLVASEKFVYSCSNDGTVKAWNISTGEFVRLIYENAKHDVMKLYLSGDHNLYAGDVEGNVFIFYKHELREKYKIYEEISGLCAKDKYLFTAGTLDMVITELKPGHGNQFTTRKSENGRGPIVFVNDKLCFLNRDGRNITVLNIDQDFKNCGNLEGHELIVNTLCDSSANNTLLSGGYDKTIKIWDLKTMKCQSSIEFDKCVNSIVCDGEHIYVTGDNGIVRYTSK